MKSPSLLTLTVSVCFHLFPSLLFCSIPVSECPSNEECRLKTLNFDPKQKKMNNHQLWFFGLQTWLHRRTPDWDWITIEQLDHSISLLNRSKRVEQINTAVWTAISVKFSFSSWPKSSGDNDFIGCFYLIDGCGVRLRPWCTLAYWELRQRVGRLFPVTQPSVAIFSDESPHRECATGLCLSALTSQRPAETDAVRRTRQKVGLGMIIANK